MPKQPSIALNVLFYKEENLDVLLKSVYSVFDEYNFTLGCTEENRPLCEDNIRKVKNFLKAMAARGYRTTYTEYPWNDDFGAARNFNWANCKSDWGMFLDGDDELHIPNGDHIRQLVASLDKNNPQVKGVFVSYRYDKNETLNTMRLCRWGDGGWTWCDAIHERLELQAYELPEGGFGQCDDGSVYVLHKFKTAEEKKAAVLRNAVIAEREYYATTDAKYKARLARSVAMAKKMEGRAAESIPWQKELYEHYKSYPEGRQGAADISKALLTLAQKEPEADHLESALEWAKKAGPAYEGLVHHASKRWGDVIKAAQRSAGAGQQATHEGYIFEQGLIYAVAADAALELGYRPEVIERLINKIPAQLRTESIIHEPVKFLSAQVDRITIIVPGTPQFFDENGGGGMLGGSEEAVMYLSRELAGLGRNVRVFAPLPPHRLPGLDKYGVDWQEIDSFDIDAEHGVAVFWRATGMVLNLMRAKAEGEATIPGLRRTYLWLHDIHSGVPGDLQKIAFGGVDGVITLSKFHRDGIDANSPGVGRYFDLGNGIPGEDFVPSETDPVRDPNLVLFTSSPDRGLLHLLRAWPKVKVACPEARLEIFYDWAMLERMQPKMYEQILATYESVRPLDVVHLGGVDHATLHQKLKSANVWAYSHFDNVTVETHCISLCKAKAAGCFPLISGEGALPETADGWGEIVEDSEKYADRLIHHVLNPASEEFRLTMRRAAIERHNWKSLAKRFSDLWTQRFDPRTHA